MTREELKPTQIREIIRSEFRQIPEIRWIQNIRNPAYHLRHPIPITIERAEDAVTTTYHDVDLCGTGDSVEAAISDFFAKFVAHYEALRETLDKSHESTFLKRIVEEIESPAWQELKRLYREKLEVTSYVQ